MGFQLGNTRFHINFSSGSGAVFEFGLLIRATFDEGANRAQWHSGFMTGHGSIHRLFQLFACKLFQLSNWQEP
jgi:hypothetical protein